MKLTVIGKYGPFPKRGGATSCYLLETDENVLIMDMGSGSFARLQERIDLTKISAIFISHFHADHSSDLAVLAYYLEQLKKRRLFDGAIKLFCPHSSSPLDCLARSFSCFEIIELSNGYEAELGGDKFMFYEGRHPEPSFGVIASDGRKRFAYGGDTNDCSSLKKFFDSVDLTLVDGGLIERDYSEQSPHLSVRKCVEYTQKYGNKSIITHICPLYTEDEIIRETQGEERCRIAEEGKTYEI